MTYQEFNNYMQQIGEKIGCPAALHHFKSAVSPPFLIWVYEERDDLYADNANYQRIQPVRISFCSDFIDVETEAKIEDLLQTSYRKYEATYIDSEKMYQTDYEIGVLING